MHRHRVVLWLALGAVLALPFVARAATVEEQVTAAYAAWDKALNSGDPAALAAFYTEDAMFLPASHDVIEGPNGVERFFTGLLGNGVHDHKLELLEVVDDGKGDLVVAAAKWSIQGKDASGAPATFGGVATHVFEKQPDGSLKLKVHTFN